METIERFYFFTSCTTRKSPREKADFIAFPLRLISNPPRDNSHAVDNSWWSNSILKMSSFIREPRLPPWDGSYPLPCS